MVKPIGLVRLLPLLILVPAARATAQVPTFEPITDACGIEDVTDITDLYGNGVAAADFDDDGDIDFYLTTEAGIADRLYRNNGQGQFAEVALELGIEEWRSNRAALWLDYNGDHLLDLLVVGEACVNRSCPDPVLVSLYAQGPDGAFVDVTAQCGIDLGPEFDNLPFYGIGGLAAADLDGDDYLDLILTVWGGGLKYFHNNGNGTFSDLTAGSGLENGEKMYWQCMMHDFNEDGKIDIYCNVDYGKNQLWINQGNIFEERAEQYGLDNAFNEMGMTLGDPDNDGDLDIYATNITRAFQGAEQFNIYYKNDMESGRARFQELARSLGVSQSGWDWGATFIDINNDGRQDLATTNGWNDAFWGPDASHLWLNTAAGFFEVSDRCGFNDRLSATTLLAFDYDRDGDLDLLQSLKDNADTKKPVIIYKNKLEEIGQNHNYVAVKPRMPGANHFAVGSQVTIHAGNHTSSRVITAGTSFYGQEPAEAFFGIGDREQVNEVVVKWPDNTLSVYRDLPLNQVSVLDYEVIASPSGLTADTITGSIQLSWIDHSGNETGFRIQRSSDSLFRVSDNFTVNAGLTSYRDENIAFNTVYYYRVCAFNEQVASAYSNTAFAGPFEELVVPNSSSVKEVIVFPNPARGEIFIKLPAAVTGSVWISVADTMGRMVVRKKHYYDESTDLLTESLDLPAGIYFLRAQLPELEFWQKIMVMR